jgi:ubiquinone/menaquinone biosynthesis C-methylase UbiE
MDEIYKTNRERWNALARANVEYTQPFLEFTNTDAQRYVGRHGILQDISGKKVLCLASGGGQDSAAFGILGAEVSVLDLSDVQLERDQQAAAHHGYTVNTCQGDMRDLSIFLSDSFDIVWQAYSLNFVPSVEQVFRGVQRILNTGGVYHVDFANPFVMTVDEEAWDGKDYPLKHKYIDGENINQYYPYWDVAQPDGSSGKLPGPLEYRHTLSSVLNTLAGLGFILLGLWEWIRPDPNPEPGTWAHFTQVAPPYLESFWRLVK